VVRVRDRRRGGNHGLDRLGLRGRHRELLVARLRDGVERRHGNELRLSRLDPVGFVVNESDQGDSTYTRAAHGDRRPAQNNVEWPIRPPPQRVSPYAGPASSRTYVVACQVLTRHLSAYPTPNGVDLAT